MSTLARLTCLASLALALFACGAPSEEEDDSAASEDAVSSRNDSISKPTDTGITLSPGLWHDDKLSIAQGWRMYKFTPRESGLVAFQMRADPALATGRLWTYLRILDTAKNNEVWAAVADRTTNLTDVIVEVEANRTYQVIATTQNNSTANDLGKPNISEGAYTVAAMPLATRF